MKFCLYFLKLALLAGLLSGFHCNLLAQPPLPSATPSVALAASPPPRPASTPFVIPPLPTPAITGARVVEADSSAAITFGNAEVLTAWSKSGVFPAIALHRSETIDIALLLPATAATAPIRVQALDGGTIEAAPTTQTGVIRFQAGTQPGLYRVVVQKAGIPLTLQFWVPDSKNPKAVHPVINPGH